ncbi:Zinc finger protein 106 [Takifugu flavidus]|uniref:Zinc finger protein 106 n=1 Tax=Takifugu flavidus TaxID=433684 RepID=A0A5C6P2Y9_9TELE|nr:Zinc finger protein 106 [Takifugu flavidus]
MGATGDNGCYRGQRVLQVTTGATGDDGCYRGQRVLQVTTGATGDNGCYSNGLSHKMERNRKCILCETVHASKQEMDEHMRSMLHHRELEKLKGR